MNETDPLGLWTPLYNNLGVGGGMDGTGQISIGDPEGVAALDQAVENAHGLAGYNGYWTNGEPTGINVDTGQPSVQHGEVPTQWVPGIMVGATVIPSDILQAIKGNWLRVERGSWKQTIGSGASKIKGVWFRNKLHFHFDPFPRSKELMKYHLPYQAKAWGKNFKAIWNRRMVNLGNWSAKWLGSDGGGGVQAAEQEADE